MRKLVMTFTGASCSGKSTLSKHLQARYGHIFSEVVSHTTRPMRAGERDGYDYYFINDSLFTAMSEANQFIEEVTFNNCRYGGAIAEFERIFREGKVAILVCEPNGVKHIAEACKKLDYDHISVGFDVSIETIIARWLTRVSAEIHDNGFDEAKVAKYASRIVETFEKESNWVKLGHYDIVLHNEDKSDFDSNVEAMLFFVDCYKRGAPAK